MKELKLKTTFRATGQTGILISGEGIPIDAVVSDFVSGAAKVFLLKMIMIIGILLKDKDLYFTLLILL